MSISNYNCNAVWFWITSYEVICTENDIFLLSEDHALGLSTFTIMAGLGGAMGYMMGGIDWGWLGEFLRSTWDLLL